MIIHDIIGISVIVLIAKIGDYLKEKYWKNKYKKEHIK